MEYLTATSILVLGIMGISLGVERKCGEDAGFLKTLFLRGVWIRAGVGLLIYVFTLQEFFGGDSITYDIIGGLLVDTWRGVIAYDPYLFQRYLSTSVSGWGMHYWVAIVYRVVGNNQLAVQAINWLLGAALPILIYYIAEMIFQHKAVSERAAMLTAFFPSLILWSSQALKDVIILFALCVVVFGVLKMRQRVSIGILLFTGAGFFILYAMRFYVFYIMIVSVAAAVFMGSVKSVESFARQAIMLAVVGGALLYMGVGRQAVEHYETIDLAKIQITRGALADSSSAGYGADVDVSSEGGVAKILPIGLAYLLLAPFPWEFRNLRQLITLPEMIVWWAMIPLVASGIWYAIRFRLAESSAILLFTLGLTLAYAVFLGNVGTAYRQRSQILVFFFLFGAVGYTLRANKNGPRPQSQRVSQVSSAARPAA